MIDKRLPELPCRDLVELITDYLEERLSPVDRARFEAHLAECEACRTYLDQLRQTPHTRLPLHEGELDNLIGIVHMKRVAQELARDTLTRERLIEIARTREPYFVPEGTSLTMQLNQFQRNRRRLAFVVDEYGDIQGFVTLEDILEEIVGEFTTDPATITHKHVHREAPGVFIINMYFMSCSYVLNTGSRCSMYLCAAGLRMFPGRHRPPPTGAALSGRSERAGYFLHGRREKEDWEAGRPIDRAPATGKAQSSGILASIDW